ncbi:MAG: hypothetical protein ACOC2J_00545 [bacterium]
MARRLFDEKNGDVDSEQYNAYNLFLILILLILSEDVLLKLRAQILKKKKYQPAKRGIRQSYTFLAEKKEVKREGREPKEEPNDRE